YVTLGAFRQERYMLSDQTMSYAKAGLIHAQASNNLSAIAEGIFLVGFCHAQRGQWSEAEENMLAALRLAERIGNATTMARVLTHLTKMYRRGGQVAGV